MRPAKPTIANGIAAATLGAVGFYLEYRYYAFGGSLTTSGTTNLPFQYVGKPGYYRHPGTVNSHGHYLLVMLLAE